MGKDKVNFPIDFFGYSDRKLEFKYQYNWLVCENISFFEARSLCSFIRKKVN